MVKRKAVEKSETALVGMQEIAAYLGRGPTTVLYFIRCENFPAYKNKGAWESDKEAVDEWRKARLKRALSQAR